MHWDLGARSEARVASWRILWSMMPHTRGIGMIDQVIQLLAMEYGFGRRSCQEVSRSEVCIILKLR